MMADHDQMIKLQNQRVIPFGFRKGNTEHLVTSSNLCIVFGSIYSILGTNKKKLSTFIVDCGWRESRLPSLARVLLCLLRVGVP